MKKMKMTKMDSARPAQGCCQTNPKTGKKQPEAENQLKGTRELQRSTRLRQRKIETS
jgi:hypothetical protein